MYDPHSLPFGWKLSPPICQSVVGTHVSPKSVLEPGKVVKWLGKEVELVSFSIANLLGLQVRIIAYLIKIFDSRVSVKDLQRVMGLINWMATRATGHLPFLGGGGILCGGWVTLWLVTCDTRYVDCVGVCNVCSHAPFPSARLLRS